LHFFNTFSIFDIDFILFFKLKIQDELNRWGLQFKSDIVQFQARVIGNENIRFGGGKAFESVNADWTPAFRCKLYNTLIGFVESAMNTELFKTFLFLAERLLSCIPLNVWVIIVPQRDAQAIEGVYRSMSQVSRPLAFQIQAPREM